MDECDLEDIENGLQFVLLYIILRFKVILPCCKADQQSSVVVVT